MSLRKGACNCTRRALAWAMLCLVFLSLSACARSEAQGTIICGNDENSSYPEILSEIVPSYTVITEQFSRTAFSSLHAGNEVEAFDAQAIPALEKGIAEHWYPHYLATVVIAVDRDKTDARIGSWSDLPAAGEMVGCSDRYPDKHLLTGAMAHGLEGDRFTIKQANGLLEALHSKKRLVLNTFDAPIVICYDYQAAALIKSGRNMQVIIPNEGTLAYQKGLLAGRELSFTGEIEPLLLSRGFRLLDGRCDETLYPDWADYENADVVTDYEHFNTVLQDVHRAFRRSVLRTRLYTSADTREHQFFALVYMVLVIVWTAWFLRRAMQKGVKRAAAVTGIILLGWITVRLIKYQIEESMVLNRYLWYAFYLFQLTLPLVLLWLAWVIDKADGRTKTPRWLRAMALVNGMLMILVFTNDLHNWVFRLDLSNPDWASQYGYGIGFLLVTAAWTLPLIGAVLMLAVKSRRAPRKSGFVFPLAFCALLILYGIGYIIRVPIAWESDYTMVVGLFTLLFTEVCMRSGMVPVNTKYERLFTHSPLNMQIVDGSGATVLSSAAAVQVDHELLRSALASYPLPAEQDEDTLLFATGITGGYALWQEDISSLNHLHAEIVESMRKLAAANAVLAEEAKIKQAIDEEAARNQLMVQLENEIAGYMTRLSAMIEQLDPLSAQPKETARIALLLCYVKRRCNLFFRARETDGLPADELMGYIDEVAEMAGYSGVKILVTNELETEISVRQATLLYGLCYVVADWAAKRECPTMLVHLESGKETASMRLLLPCDARSFEL
ncbi:MAG: histidine kinase N-terminal 7TM domain-containing protein, partial [Christensenellales bacterium]